MRRVATSCSGSRVGCRSEDYTGGTPASTDTTDQDVF